MPVDPCFAPLLADPRNELRALPAHVALADLRAGNNAFLEKAPGVDLHSVRDFVVAGPAGDLRLRAYRPCPETSLPVVLFMHGGGFVLGDLETHDAMCRRLARSSRAVVVAVDYRLAPEARFPCAVEDCVAAFHGVVTGVKGLDVDASRIALCGDSAGGHLATVVALRARDAAIPVRHLALVYPAMDPACDSESMRAFARGHLLSRSGMQWCWSQYLRDAADARHPEIALLQRDLHGLPQTTIVTAECDPLRDEGEAFAHRLRQSGVPVSLHRYPGMVHGFAGLPHVTPLADAALSRVGTRLSAALA